MVIQLDEIALIFEATFFILLRFESYNQCSDYKSLSI